MNPTYVIKAKEEINKLLKMGLFILQIKQNDYLQQLLFLRRMPNFGFVLIIENLMESQNQILLYYFFSNIVLEMVVRYELYPILDGFNGYNQIPMVVKDQLKSYFIIKWRPFAYQVMSFDLKNVPTAFQRIVMHAFAKYLNDFM